MYKIDKLLQLLLQKPQNMVHLLALSVIGIIVHYAYDLALSGVNITYMFCVIAIAGIIAIVIIAITCILYFNKQNKGNFDD